MPKVTFNIEGFDEFEKQLKEIAEGFRADLVVRNTLRVAADEAMQPALSTAYSLAHLGPDNKYNIHMKNTLRINTRIPNEKDKLSYYVNEGDAVISVLSVKRSAVSLANEFGTSKVAAHPFLRVSLKSNIPKIIETLKKSLGEIIPKYAKKVAKIKSKGI